MNPKTGRFNLKEGILLCFFVIGIRYGIHFIFLFFHLPTVILEDIVFLAIVIFIVKCMQKEELTHILVWRDVPFSTFASILVMFFGFEILQSELSNILQIIIPVPDEFFPDESSSSIFLVILTSALFPAFTEEIFFRGIILRNFSRIYSTRKAILLSALLFGLMHINPWQTVHAFISGIFLGWIYRRYKTIWLCMFIHAYNNVLASFMLVPVTVTRNPDNFRVLVFHPLWFDILGLFLFAFGFVSVYVTGKPGGRPAGPAGLP
jgi:membrane protease YdiL (CAAX protease family)